MGECVVVLVKGADDNDVVEVKLVVIAVVETTVSFCAGVVDVGGAELVAGVASGSKGTPLPYVDTSEPSPSVAPGPIVIDSPLTLVGTNDPSGYVCL